jgi:hypothetical protein
LFREGNLELNQLASLSRLPFDTHQRIFEQLPGKVPKFEILGCGTQALITLGAKCENDADRTKL